MTVAQAQRRYWLTFSEWVELGGMSARDRYADWLLKLLGDLDGIVVQGER